MKKLTSLLIGCSLALASAAMAQQPEDQSSPEPKHGAEKARPHAQEAKPRANPKELKPADQPAEPHGAKIAPVAPKIEKSASNPTVAPHAPTHVKAANEKIEPKVSATPAVKVEEHKKGMRNPGAKASATPTTAVSPAATVHAPVATPAATVTPAPTVQATPMVKPMTTPAASASVSPIAGSSVAPSPVVAPSPALANERNGRGNNPGGVAKKPDPQQVQKIKTEHVNFKAQPKPDKIPAVTFTENRQIEGSDRWQGRQYEAFRSYRSERHDERWYHSHYNRVELIGGGYYYWTNGYWYPAWGYNNEHQYYAYDGPIYVGQRAEPLDRVIANVQGVLQEMGYYKGEVDGLLGPLTRQALTSYQDQQGLAPTAAIDEPTLDALGMGS